MIMIFRTRASPTAPEGLGGEPDPPPPHPAMAMPMNKLTSVQRFANLVIVNNVNLCTRTIGRKARAFPRTQYTKAF
jgi:hypothetical protein